MENRRFQTILLSVLLAVSLLLPAAASALDEDRLETAPVVVLQEEKKGTEETENTAASVPYLPFTRELPDREEEIPEEEELWLPRLTNKELARTRQLMEELREGKQLSWNDYGCANKTENVVVGVYALDPGDFDGETFYVLLPAAVMNDNMLLSLISAFEELGIPFDPDSLNERNCIRGDSYDHGNRGLSYEESVRMKTIRYQVHRGMIDPEKIPSGTYCRYAEMAWQDVTSFVSKPFRFCFYPYRSMTDNELAAFAFAQEGVWQTDPDRIEAQALSRIRACLKTPLAIIAEDEQMGRWTDGTLIYENSFTLPYADEVTGRAAYPNGKPSRITVWQKQEPGKQEQELYQIRIEYYMEPLNDSKHWPEYSEEDWIAAARKWAAEALKLPAEELSEWMIAVDTGLAGYTDLIAETKDMEIELILNKWDAGGYAAFLFRK